MAYDIIEIHEDKKRFLPLLLLADESEAMIDRYLSPGRLFVLKEGGVVRTVAVVLALNETECELKNLATDPAWQRQGYGKAMVRYLADHFLKAYQTLYVGTGEVPGILGFYRRCGFRPSHRIENFFVEHYPEPIVEEGIRLVDMVVLRQDAGAPEEACTP